MITLYGIPNCNTVKKSRTWLENHGIEYAFYDYKKLGVDEEKLKQWLKQISLDRLMNRQGLTYRKLSDEDKAQSNIVDYAIGLMSTQPSIIKRPLIENEKGEILTLGFDEVEYGEVFIRKK